MGDDGTGGIERVESNRRCSEAHPSAHEDQIPQPSAKSETSKSTSEEQKFESAGPRHLSSSVEAAARRGIHRNASTGSNASVAQGGRHERARRPLEPPVTKTTLGELDVTKIIHNPKLRHDINFDPELHFRPNLDGDKGKRKQDKANQFWTALGAQLQQFVEDRDEFMRQFGHGEEWCLPLLLKSVKEIIQTLVPTKDRMYLDEGLNVDLIMQQFSRGMADLEKLASWLSGVLKSHCAPMRDEWVDQMYNQLTNGNRTNDMGELVQGMRNLLSVLEAMKLDVANHQIRCLRPILIEDTVHFEQRFFLKKIRDGKLDTQPAQTWYSRMCGHYPRDPLSIQTFGETAAFFEALSGMIMPLRESHLADPPNTFLFDDERVLKLRADMLDAINLEICMRSYDELEKKYRHHDAGLIPTPFLTTPFSDYSGFRSSSTEESDFDFFTPPTSTSRPSSMVFSSAGSASSSPRSSLILPSVPAVKTLEDQRAKSRDLYDSLVALLQTSAPGSRSATRWKAMKDSLALQIFRFTNAPTHELSSLEDQLDQNLSGHVGSVFPEVQADFHRRLLAELQLRVKEFKGLTGISLFSVATGGRLQGPGRTWEGSREGSREREHASSNNSVREAREEGGLDDMATRLAHLGLLHWRVWAQLAYVGDVDSDMVDDVHMTM
ncbi:Uu.00g064660.m01.CDS01 [Anthostomella pinea]|uniref:Uu.00g064660.m01.CDS01 n=1 Tax=Anthostomella pinea TaxID=933095 RepID=A0AAI8VN09_9PEZI|nr:Uu.00g064660.m01.CDS01 [Anthostomella pinea]